MLIHSPLSVGRLDLADTVFVVLREAGLNLELSDVAVQSLVPAPLQNVASADEFMQQLPQYDADLAQQVSEAEAAGECLRFVGEILGPPLATFFCEQGEAFSGLPLMPRHSYEWNSLFFSFFFFGRGPVGLHGVLRCIELQST